VYDNTFGWVPTGMFADRGDPAAQYDFHSADLTFDATWRTLDLSGIIPTEARAVVMKVHITNDTAGQVIRFEREGNSNHNTDHYCRALVANQQQDYCITVAVNPSNRSIQYRGGNGGTWSNTWIIITGWF
jgi:hypothetical protein